MKENRAEILDPLGKAIAGTRAFLIGNNASWICVNCKELVGGRTGKREKKIVCDCGKTYLLTSYPNERGNFHQGPVKSVSAL
jgi:hypothetical protein